MMDDSINSFAEGGMKPYWLTPSRDKLAALGLLGENTVWSAASNKLFLFCWKNQIEAVRKTEMLSGYQWWLIQDYWMYALRDIDIRWPMPTISTSSG
jgi:hypothetical protein